MKRATRPAILKWRQTAPELILCAVRWYLRYSLSLRDVEELLAERGLAGIRSRLCSRTQSGEVSVVALIQHELPNFCPSTFARLSLHASRALKRMRQRPTLYGFLAASATVSFVSILCGTE